jgi:hypothetical protein
MTIKELREKMPEGYIMVRANLKGRKNSHGFNHVYHEGRIYLTFGLAWYARYPKAEFSNYVTTRFAGSISAGYVTDITENYKNNPQSQKLLKKLDITLNNSPIT